MKVYFSVLITISLLLSKYKGADAIYCYECNSNWAACGENPNLSLIQYNKVPCQGPCSTWRKDGILYRGCVYDPKKDNPLSYTDSNGITYGYCYSELCNSQPIVVSDIKTTTIKPLTTVSITYSTSTVSTTTPKKTIYCYECNSRWAACANPPNLAALQYNKVPCKGACVTFLNSWDANILYRGCLDTITDGKSGKYTANGNIYNYCSTDLCNTGDSAGNLVLTSTAVVVTLPPSTTLSSSSSTIISGITSSSTKPASAISSTTKSASTTSSSVTIPNNNNYLVTYDEFVKAVTSAGYPTPSQEKYLNYVTQLESKGGITSKREAAMFLSQIMWESDGLKATSEYACAVDQCAGQYGYSAQYPDQHYYGRGYIQLTWPYNYEACSRALYGDDRLLKDPNQVATNDEIAWATAFWYWKANVGSNPNVKNGYFGTSTMAINGGLECNGPYQDKARKRFDIYKNVMKQFNINETPIENGCYN